MQTFVEVRRPNPTRTERCEVLDKRRRVGGEHILVRGADGKEFMAVKYMGTWGQPDGWFDLRHSPWSDPAVTLEDKEILASVRKSYAHDHNIVTVFEIIDRVLAPDQHPDSEFAKAAK